MKIADAISILNGITSVFKIISPNYVTYPLSIELIKKNNLSSDLIFDAYLAATALSNDVKELATDNVKDFKKFREITVVNPFL